MERDGRRMQRIDADDWMPASVEDGQGTRRAEEGFGRAGGASEVRVGGAREERGNAARNGF